MRQTIQSSQSPSQASPDKRRLRDREKQRNKRQNMREKERDRAQCFMRQFLTSGSPHSYFRDRDRELNTCEMPQNKPFQDSS